MRIIFALDTITAWQSGIWFHRIETPAQALKKRGHAVKQIVVGKKNNTLFELADTVIFGRIYPVELDVLKLMRELKKKGIRILYDMDDDFWQVEKHNPSYLVSNAYKTQYETFIREADALITPSKILAKKFKKLAKRKPVFICPNGIDYALYHERPRERKELVIGYMGAASHWKDLQIPVKAIVELYKKYDFSFDLYGLTGEPLEAAMYYYKKLLDQNLKPEKNEYFKAALDFYDQIKLVRGRHYPFMPPELHPGVLSRCDFDIGIAPLENTEFNRGKSCIKFYEYAAVGTVTLASKVEPYKSEVNYTAKNTWKDWYKKLEKLIVDEKFREKILKEQQEYVKKNRSLEAIGLDWELACQPPGGLKVKNQER